MKYDRKTEQLLKLLPAYMTERDFALLALACADQAGLGFDELKLLGKALIDIGAILKGSMGW